MHFKSTLLRERLRVGKRGQGTVLKNQFVSTSKCLPKFLHFFITVFLLRGWGWGQGKTFPSLSLCTCLISLPLIFIVNNSSNGIIGRRLPDPSVPPLLCLRIELQDRSWIPIDHTRSIVCSASDDQHLVSQLNRTQEANAHGHGGSWQESQGQGSGVKHFHLISESCSRSDSAKYVDLVKKINSR